MSGGGGGGVVEETEMIALSLFGLEQQMDQYGAMTTSGSGVIDDQKDLEKGDGAGRQQIHLKGSDDTGNGLQKEGQNAEDVHGRAKFAGLKGSADVEGGKGGEGGGGEAKSSGRLCRGRRRRHSEKSLRAPPRAKGAIVRQVSEDSNGFINLFFDSESEMGLTLTGGDSHTIPESDSRPSFSDSASQIVRPRGECPALVDIPKDTDRAVDDDSRDSESGGQRLEKSIPVLKKALDYTDPTKSGGPDGGGGKSDSDGQDAGLGISLSVVDSREYSPSPGGDTQPLLLDEGHSESSLRIIGEIVIPFFLAGLGCVFAGIVLDLVKVSTIASSIKTATDSKCTAKKSCFST